MQCDVEKQKVGPNHYHLLSGKLPDVLHKVVEEASSSPESQKQMWFFHIIIENNNVKVFRFTSGTTHLTQEISAEDAGDTILMTAYFLMLLEQEKESHYARLHLLKFKWIHNEQFLFAFEKLLKLKNERFSNWENETPNGFHCPDGKSEVVDPKPPIPDRNANDHPKVALWKQMLQILELNETDERKKSIPQEYWKAYTSLSGILLAGSSQLTALLGYFPVCGEDSFLKYLEDTQVNFFAGMHIFFSVWPENKTLVANPCDKCNYNFLAAVRKVIDESIEQSKEMSSSEL